MKIAIDDDHEKIKKQKEAARAQDLDEGDEDNDFRRALDAWANSGLPPQGEFTLTLMINSPMIMMFPGIVTYESLIWRFLCSTRRSRQAWPRGLSGSAREHGRGWTEGQSGQECCPARPVQVWRLGGFWEQECVLRPGAGGLE